MKPSGDEAPFLTADGEEASQTVTLMTCLGHATSPSPHVSTRFVRASGGTYLPDWKSEQDKFTWKPLGGKYARQVVSR